MPRKARIDAPGALHHVIIRGIERRKIFREFVKKGIAEGRRPESKGGGLLRSIGGWKAHKGFHKAGIRVKGDERILGDSDFVENVLKSAEEALEEKYELKARGYDFDWAICRVAKVLDMPPAQVTAFGKSLLALLLDKSRKMSQNSFGLGNFIFPF